MRINSVSASHNNSANNIKFKAMRYKDMDKFYKDLGALSPSDSFRSGVSRLISEIRNISGPKDIVADSTLQKGEKGGEIFTFILSEMRNGAESVCSKSFDSTKPDLFALQTFKRNIFYWLNSSK